MIPDRSTVWHMRQAVNADWNSRPMTLQISDSAIRASGDCICDICGFPYYRHPFEDRILSFADEPFLNRLCDGTTLVKL